MDQQIESGKSDINQFRSKIDHIIAKHSTILITFGEMISDVLANGVSLAEGVDYSETISSTLELYLDDLGNKIDALFEGRAGQ